jgi:class 3 adenylate cyclase
MDLLTERMALLRAILIILTLLGLTRPGLSATWVFEPGRKEFINTEDFRYLCSQDSQDWTTVLQRSSLMKLTGRLNLGIVDDQECWSLITVENRSDSVERVLLEHGLTLTSLLELYHVVDGNLIQHQTLGLAVPFAHWSIDYRLPIFDLRLEPGLNTLLLRQRSQDVFLLDWRLYSPENFYSRIMLELLLFGGFFAICFALSFYNMVIYFVNREISHVFYFLYLNSYAIAQAFLTGFLKQFTFHEMENGMHQLGLISINVALGFTTYFFYFFLDFHETKGWFRRMVHGYGVFLLTAIAVTLWGPVSLAAHITQFLSISCSLLAILAGVIAWRKRHPLSTYFLIAWSMLIVGNIIQVLHLQGIVPDEPWIISLNFVGASFEAIIISYALAHKMRLGRLQEAQRRRHAFSQLEKMVYPHQIEKMKMGGILETTMPHASGEAVVICLDIIASTSSQIENLSNFLRRFFDRCGELMSRDYQGDPLSASGFRIKEMGDGFLCAVGFPFQTPQGRVSHEVAIQLAFGFLEAFDQEFADTLSEERTYCSIGIARGRIQGFFTVSGIRSYELFGDSIVLATRYEGLRKQWPADRPGHIITMPTRMYESLPLAFRPLFQQYKLGPGSQQIRNDADADSFYRGVFEAGEAHRILQSEGEFAITDQAS